MAALLCSDVTRERVHVRRGKGGRARFIPTHPAIWDYVAGRTGPVLLDAEGRPYTPERLTGSQGLHWKRIGMPEIHLHRFRHWFGTTLVDNGVGIDVVCELMGHRSVATTQGYVRVSQVRRDAAIQHLPMTTPEPGSSWLGRAAEAAA
jgi:integrase/recombinase XerC